ncbi:K(+)/H(+) antiporter 1, partial [Leucoagaricus sp. SymC.cos]
RVEVSFQGGVISGDNPVTYNASDPFRLWVIQVVIIIFMTQALSFFLNRIRQPRVISEVIGGIILGPTVMGRIPHFKDRIFPDVGMPLLNLTSTVGLVFYLFLVGLEIDTRMVKRRAAASAAVSVAGLVIPLGLGAAVGIGIYHEFINPSVNFGYFLLFVAVAVGITAFPVLCRILTELKLLDTTVGIVTLSAGVGNDVIGWVLLALTVALVNASSGLTALWVLLCCVGYTLFLLYPVRFAFVLLARRTGSLEQGSPTAGMMTVTLLIVLASAFFTDIIGVHAIFGGFLAGLIVPHENGFAISLVEKLEDLVFILFMPIYFTLSGLRTNLGLLNNGITWGYTILLCTVSFSGKFLACALAAFSTGFNWRESGAIGSLMSCKGLVELIVLNIGLSANILDTRTFSMFVVHALILTILTTPLVLLFYPERIRKHEGETLKANRGSGAEEAQPRPSSSDDGHKTRISVVLDKIDQLPAAMMLSQLVNSNPSAVTLNPIESSDEKVVSSHDTSEADFATPTQPRFLSINIGALRLIELTTRTSAVLKSQEAESLIHNDPVVSIFRTFGALNKLSVSASLSVVNQAEYPEAIARHAQESDSQLVILLWSRGSASVYEGDTQGLARNPFDGVFHKSNLHIQDQTSSIVYSEFIRGVFLKSPSDVALFVDRGLSREAGSAEHHLFLPFFGGPDDRLALTFLVQLCHNPLVTATVVRISKTEVLSPLSTIAEAKGVIAGHVPASAHHTTLAAADTIYGQQSTQTRLASSTADGLLWDKYTTSTEGRSAALTAALSRINFGFEASAAPLRTVVDLSLTTSTQNPGKTVTILLGRSRRLAVESHQTELRQIMAEAGGHISSSVPKTLGDVGAALVAKGIHTNLFVMQAAVPSYSS